MLSIGQPNDLPNISQANEAWSPDVGCNTAAIEANPENYNFFGFEPADIKSVDNKLDDGLANSGEFFSFNACGNTTGLCHSNGNYRADFSHRVCRSCYSMF